MLRKTIRRRHLPSLLYLRNPLNDLKNPLLTFLIPTESSKFSFFCSLSWKPFTVLAQFSRDSEEKIPKRREQLSVFFKSAVGLSESLHKSEIETEGEHDCENADLIEGLIKLEEEVRILKKKRSKNVGTFKLQTEKSDPVTRSKADRSARNKIDLPVRSKADSAAGNGVKAKRSLWGLFSDIDDGGKSIEPTDFGLEDPLVHKELSPDMEMFAKHLYLEGYLKDANFIPKNEFDSTSFETAYSREFLKFAAVKFGTDHQEIAKWLSASDLKKIALFGCPSLGQKTVHAAKKLRSFFEIEEHEVCQKCPLKESCKLAYKSYSHGKELRLGVVTRLLGMYALGSVPKQLIVPEEIIASVSRLLKEIVNLSRTVS